MGDDDQGPAVGGGLEVLHDPPLRGLVQGAGRLVQHEDQGLAVEGAGEPDALPLPSGEPRTPLPDGGAVALGALLDEPVGAGELRRLDHALHVHLVGGDAERDVLREGAVPQVDRLGNMGDARPPVPNEVTLQRLIADEDRALRRLLQSHQEVREGGLAAPGGPHEADGSPSRDLEVNAPEHLAGRSGVPEGEPLTLDPVEGLVRP